MSLYQQELKRAINEQSKVVKYFIIHIQETKIELKNEIDSIERKRLMKRLQALYSTKKICEECLKNTLKQIH